MKVLVIRYSSQGDVILITPVLRLLKDQINASVHVLTKEAYVPLLSHNPNIDQVHIFEKISFSILKNEAFDLIVDLQKNFRSLVLNWRLGAKRLSYDKMTFKKWQFLLFRINRLNKSHVVSRYIKSLESLGIVDDGLGLDLTVVPDYNMGFRNKSRKLIVIAMGGTYVTKQIPASLCHQIVKREDLDFVLIGGPDVSREGLPASEHVKNLIGVTTLSESSALISQADVVISGDTGMMHIASALQKPLIVIWGSTSPEFGFYPYYGSKSALSYNSVENLDLTCRPCSKYGRKSCPKGHMKCLNNIDPAAVHLEIDKMIE